MPRLAHPAQLFCVYRWVSVCVNRCFLRSGFILWRYQRSKECEAAAKLHEVAVESQIGHPIDHVSHVLPTGRTFNADETMTIGCPFLHDYTLCERKTKAREELSIFSRPYPDKPQLREVALYRQQRASRIRTRYQARGFADHNVDGIVITVFGDAAQMSGRVHP